jgi:hypothetical protein
MNMPWFRFYSEALNDRKIARVVRISGQPKALVMGVWLTLLCLANDSPVRGCLMISEDMWLDEDEIMADTGLDPVTFGKVIGAFRQLGMVSISQGYELPNWDKRQFSSDNSTARVRKYRAKKKVETSVTKDETLPKRFSNVIDTDTDTDTEQIQIETRLTSALSAVAKETYAPGFHEKRYESAISWAVKNDITPDEVGDFGEWWINNGWHNDRPSLTNIMDNWPDFKAGRCLKKDKQQQQKQATEHLSGSW